MAARDQPAGIEPAVGLAVIRQPVDVPMADETRIGGIDGRTAADEDDATRKARQHVRRPVGGMNLDVMSRSLKAKSGTEVNVR